MNQLLETFGVNWKLLLMQAANFGLLLLVLWYYLYRPVLKIIDERRAKITEGVIIAEEANQHLNDAKAKSEEMVGSASREAESIVAESRTVAAKRGEEMVKEAEQKASGIVREAIMRADEAKRRALAESEQGIARAAMLAAEKILREKSA